MRKGACVPRYTTECRGRRSSQADHQHQHEWYDEEPNQERKKQRGSRAKTKRRRGEPWERRERKALFFFFFFFFCSKPFIHRENERGQTHASYHEESKRWHTNMRESRREKGKGKKKKRPEQRTDLRQHHYGRKARLSSFCRPFCHSVVPKF